MSADTVTNPSGLAGGTSPPGPPQPTPAAATAPTPPTPRRRRRWFWRLLPLATLLVCVWFAPMVVAKTGLRNRFARQALADLKGSVDVGGASLGWLSPIELRDVTIKDDAGRTIVSVSKVTSQKSLLALARNQSEPGEFMLEDPTIAIVCEKSTTNLEAAFAEYLKDDSKPPAPTRTPVSIRVTGGTLTLTDSETGKVTSVEGLTANVDIPANSTEPVTAKLTASTGGISAEVSVGDSGSGKFVSAGLPLETFAPLLKRVDPGLSVAGAVTTDLQVKWSKDTLAVAGTVNAKQLNISAPQLKGDKLAIDSAELPLDVELAGRVIHVRKFSLTCDVGTLSAAGTFNPDDPAEKLLTQPGVVVSGNVELAKLAAKLPKLLRLKEGLELREGKVEVWLASTADADGVMWDGKILTSSIKAVREGKPIDWEQPLSVEFLGRYASGQLPTFKKLICTSDFVAVNAKTTPETIQAAATVYLHRLTERLGQFVDLDGVTLEGIANAQLIGKLAPDGAFKATGLIEVSDFAFARGGKTLKEPALKVQLGASGTMPKTGATQVATATLALIAGGDELHLSLLEPVADVQKFTSGRVDLSISGDLARWKARAAAVTTIPAYQMSGTVVAGGKAQLTAERITVDRLTVGLTNVKFRGAGIEIDEPTMNAVGDFTLTRATNLATITKLTLNSAPLSVTAGTLTFESVKNSSDPAKDDVIVSGDGQCVADLNRLGATVKLFTNPRGKDAFHGRGVGPLRFRSASDVTSFGGTLDVTNFIYGAKEKPGWTEPTLRLEADGDYRDSTDAVTLAVAKVERPGLALDAKGSVSKATSTQDINFTGSLKYDWSKLTPLVREQLGGNFTATGTGTRTLAVTGQLSPPDAPPAPKGGPIALKAPGAPPSAEPSIFVALNGDAAIGWDTIKAYGFDVGAGDLKAKMTRGVLTVAPITATFCGGKVMVAPTVKLDTSPGEVTLAKGKLVDHAKLTPQATAGALGYALPAIANAGQAEGEISASIDDNRIPLGDFTQTNLKGTLVIHKAVIGASPVVAEIAKLLGAKNTTMTLATETAVPVQVANGRVHHQNFAVNVAGATFRTSGSVGFDNTLDLVVEVPIPKDLPVLKNNPLLVKAVAGKIVKVPVKGTLSKPTVDAKAFEHAVIALARDGAKDVGKDALEKELNKLFPGMPAPKAGGSGGLPFPFGKQP